MTFHRYFLCVALVFLAVGSAHANDPVKTAKQAECNAMLDRSNEQRATAGLALAQAEFVHATAIANADSVYNAKAAPLEELRQEIATLPKDETPDKADLLREIDAKIQVLVTQHDVDIAAADQALATAKATNAEALVDIQKSFDASVCGSDQ